MVLRRDTFTKIFTKLLFKNIFLGIQFIMNKHNQKPTDMFNKQDGTVYFIY